MANLRRAPDRRDGRDRAQIILVTGFALAMAFVALALLMNSVIYTENLATRSEAAKASDAATLQTDMINGSTQILTYIDEHNATTSVSYDTLNETFRAGLNLTRNTTRRLEARNGIALTLSHVATYNGTWINQTFEERNFTSADADETWALVPNSHRAAGIREFRINDTDPDLLDDVDCLPSSCPPTMSSLVNFTVRIENASGDWWELELYHDQDAQLHADPSYVAGFTTDDGDHSECAWGDGTDSFEIDFAERTINGSACRPLDFRDDVTGDLAVSYLNGQNASGTYQMLVNRSEGDLVADNFNETVAAGPPIVYKTLYGGRIRVAYAEERMEFETDARVVPGESDA